MQLKAGLLQTLTNSLDQEYGCIYESPKTRIYDCNRNRVIVVTKEYPKYAYYKYGLANKYEHIPKVYDLLEDSINKIYVIRREALFPITTLKKLTRLEIIGNALNDNLSLNDKITDEIRQFYYPNQNWLKLDLGPHCFMETRNKKIVVSDILMER